MRVATNYGKLLSRCILNLSDRWKNGEVKGRAETNGPAAREGPGIAPGLFCRRSAQGGREVKEGQEIERSWTQRSSRGTDVRGGG